LARRNWNAVTFNEISLKRFKTENPYSLKTALNAHKRYAVISSVVLIVVALTGFLWMFVGSQNNLKEPEVYAQNLVPKQVGEWTSFDIELGEYYFDVLGTKDLLMRTYERKNSQGEDGKDTVYLYIVRSEDSRKVAHPPELCIEGEGYSSVVNEKRDIFFFFRKIPITRVLFKKEEQGLLVYYWYRFDGENTNNFIAHQLKSVWRKSKTGSTSMIRFSVVLNPDSQDDIAKKEKAMLELIKEFTATSIEHL